MNIPETFLSVHEELFLLGISFLFGMGIGLCYDVIRAVRIIIPHNFLLTALEDVLFLIGYLFFMVAFSSAFALGQFRFYYIIGNITGFALYFVTLGNFVINTLKKLIAVIFKPFKSAYVFLCKKLTPKFVRYSKVLKNKEKNFNFLLLKSNDLVYNKKENKKRKNVNIIAKKSNKKTV